MLEECVGGDSCGGVHVCNDWTGIAMMVEWTMHSRWHYFTLHVF